MAAVPPTARKLSSTWEGLAPRRGAPPDAGWRSSGAGWLPIARKAGPHRQSRHRAECATQPGKRDGWDRARSPQAEAGLCAWAAEVRRPGGVPHVPRSVQRRGLSLEVAV
jgi:hypothetical protein